MNAPVEELNRATLRRWPLPDADGGKHSRGRVLVVGGTARTPGSVLLAAEAAFRAGAGRVQVATVGSVAVAVSVALPEALVEGLPEDDDGHIADAGIECVVELAQESEAVLLGPGMLDPERANAFLERLMPGLSTAVVVDAVAMAFLTRHRDGLHHLDRRAVVTPNLDELARTLGQDGESVRTGLEHAARELAETGGATVVSGGEQTVVADPSGALWRWSRTTPGLGVAGSGDVKSGVIAGLLARGLPPSGAAAWGAYLHQMAGRLLADEYAPVGFVARELLPVIPRAMAN